MLDCVKNKKGDYIVYDVTPDGDHSLDIATGQTCESAWMKAAIFLNEKINNLQSELNEGMWIIR